MNNNDTKLINTVKDQLINSMKNTSRSINIHCTDGIISLSGCVNVLFEKNRAEEITGKIDGVKKVINNITISLDGSISDKELSSLATENLRNSEFKHRLLGVTAKVSGGSALLIGDVETERDRQLAISEVSKTYGIISVVSDLNLASFKDDISLTNDINMAFMQSKINVNYVSSIVTRGNVALTGYVEKVEDINFLVTLAQSIPGVHSVNNKLELQKIPSGII